MTDKQVILVTGVGGYWGSRLATKLLSQVEVYNQDNNIFVDASNINRSSSQIQVIGVDTSPPKEPIENFDFIQADVRNPLFGELLKSEHVQTIVHLALIENYQASESAFDLDVIGTMKVLGAAAEAGVQKVVLRSSTSIYGARPTNPAFITENYPLNGDKANGFIRNLIEIEAFVNGFRRQVPEMVISVLRFANIVGPTVMSPMTHFLRMRPPITLFGFDPMMQVIHEDDVIDALLFAALNDVPGVYNIADEGVIPLGKILGLVGRVSLPVIHPLAYWSTGLMRSVGLGPDNWYPIEPDYLRYSLVTDLRRMREDMKFSPAYTAEEALREFAGYLRLKKFRPDKPDLAFDEERLRDTLERRRRQREHASLQKIDQQGSQQ